MDKAFALKGSIIYSAAPTELVVREGAYLVCDSGKSAGVFFRLPEQYKDVPVEDYGERLIVPGMTDLHVHASQYAYRGTDMDMELLDWLSKHAFPEEARYADERYANRAYDVFVSDLLESPTTRAAIFATVHGRATLQLMEKLEHSGLRCFVGKVNMDRECPEYLRENTEQSLEDTEKWAEVSLRLKNVKPILTPRFTPSCSDELMRGLGALAKKYSLPVQSHLSENLAELRLVRELAPSARDYADSYERFGLMGETPTIMAHCVYCNDAELERIKRRGVYVAHCPQSNTNIASGAAPVRRFLDEGQRVGLGTDVAGGASLSLLRAMCDAISVSKLRWRLLDEGLAPITMPEAFYMATLGGGSFFGRVGSFEKGYELDALVLDDGFIRRAVPLSPAERLEQIVYLGSEKPVFAKYVAGEKVFSL